MDKARLTPEQVGCWVLKSSRSLAEVAPGWAVETEQSLRRCVRTYRAGLMEAGQRCVLWVSGRRAPGVHAVGILAGAAAGPPGDAEVEVRLWRLTEPVPRAAFLAAPELAPAEVIRVPVGANPSYLTLGQAAALADLLEPGVRERAGWS